MAEGTLIHAAADGFLHRLLGADGFGFRGHYVPQLGRREVQADGGDSDEKVALGETTEQTFVIDDEDVYFVSAALTRRGKVTAGGCGLCLTRLSKALAAARPSSARGAR